MEKLGKSWRQRGSDMGRDSAVRIARRTSVLTLSQSKRFGELGRVLSKGLTGPELHLTVLFLNALTYLCFAVRSVLELPGGLFLKYNTGYMCVCMCI